MKLLLFTLVLSLANISDAKTFKFTTLDWMPYTGAKFLNGGPVLHLVKAAFNAEGHEVEFDFFPWTRAVINSKNGVYDGVVPHYTNEERRKYYNQVELPLSSPLTFCKLRAKKIRYDGDLKKLRPYRIGVGKGYANTKEFDDASYLIKEEAIDDLTNLKKLIHRRQDLILIDQYVANYLIKTSLPSASNQLDYLKPLVGENKLYISFYKKGPNPAEAEKVFRKGLEKIKTLIPEILIKHDMLLKK